MELRLLRSFATVVEAGTASKAASELMIGLNVDEIPQTHRLSERAW